MGPKMPVSYFVTACVLCFSMMSESYANCDALIDNLREVRVLLSNAKTEERLKDAQEYAQRARSALDVALNHLRLDREPVRREGAQEDSVNP